MERAGLFESEPPPVEQISLRARPVNVSQQRERLMIGAEQDMGTIVDRRAVCIDAASAPTQRARGFEDGQRMSCGGERDGRGKACVASPDDGDAFLHSEIPAPRPAAWSGEPSSTTTMSSTRSMP